jgi:carbamoyl-phosphate synthase small subunit
LRAELILENGTRFTGESIGGTEDRICEMVFNTSMTGYQEILTDPSYAGQGVVMTYPLIGNYGVNREDEESRRPWAEAFVVRSLSQRGNNFRREGDLNAYLSEHNITGMQHIDTRALTRILRNQGTMNGLITCAESFCIEERLEQIRAYRVKDTVEAVTRRDKKVYDGPGRRVALLDYGTKENLIRCLLERGCAVTVYPADTRAEEVIAGNYDGVLLSNGPGDPADCTEIIGEVKKLYDTNLPIFAVCLGHQLMALAAGAKTEKLRYGHRGGNHPVRDVQAGRVFITAQNHGYVVRGETVDPELAEISHVNVNDGTVEGLAFKRKNIFTVQFHPEASPGPVDTAYLFDRFVARMGGGVDA